MVYDVWAQKFPSLLEDAVPYVMIVVLRSGYAAILVMTMRSCLTPWNPSLVSLIINVFE